MHVELVFNQRRPTWLTCRQHAFEHLGKVPRRLVIDMLRVKPAILRAYAQDRDPQIRRAYGECAEQTTAEG